MVELKQETLVRTYDGLCFEQPSLLFLEDLPEPVRRGAREVSQAQAAGGQPDRQALVEARFIVSSAPTTEPETLPRRSLHEQVAGLQVPERGQHGLAYAGILGFEPVE